MDLVSIVTVNFNQPAVTEELLQSILQFNTHPAIEVIVVDNGSRQDWTTDWRARFPDFTFIRSEENLGFAGGNNLGIAAARGNYYFLINNDTEITDGLIQTLVKTFQLHPKAGMVSPKILYAEDRHLIQYAGYTAMNFLTGRNKCVGQYETDAGQYNGVSTETGYVHGAAMMVRKTATEKAGLMDTNYFLYYEELDWGERIKKAGYELYVNLDAAIYHKESVSVGKRSALKEYFMTRNRILFMRKHASPLAFLGFCAYYAFVVTPRNMLTYLKNREYGFIKVFFSAIRWHFTHKPDSPDLGYPL
ncbi:glycosyltransferase family 2 protein [Persicitalea jodogahamensis]|uniref:Glycosyl transferase n=1 Tax=Persicitalea jodogahamensis TaxID=402147 RepID=A0A8J3D2V0_9BACT|nr:glycosyltransferase family 2 protein [Persicitalea jodogahamensis]GHB61474.1 glycosyl transferase [Persicitalea jodogahamensis]